MTDTYEIYYRQERRSRRIQAIIAISSVVTLMLIIGVIVFWHLSDANERIASTQDTNTLR